MFVPIQVTWESRIYLTEQSIVCLTNNWFNEELISLNLEWQQPSCGAKIDQHGDPEPNFKRWGVG